jgi:hypothetical protein
MVSFLLAFKARHGMAALQVKKNRRWGRERGNEIARETPRIMGKLCCGAGRGCGWTFPENNSTFPAPATTKDDDRPRKAYQAMSCVCSTVLVSVLAGGVDGPCRVSGRPERQLS